MNANIQTKNSELLLGAATALSNQWSPNWTEKLSKLAQLFKEREENNPVGKNREEFLKANPKLESAAGDTIRVNTAVGAIGNVLFHRNDGTKR